MKFAKRYQRKRAEIVINTNSEGGNDTPFTWVLYSELKKDIKALDELECQQRKCCSDNDECPVCMEPFGTVANTVRTKCGHKMHPFCLIDTVTASTQTCPICRTTLQDLIPDGLDGDQLRFAAQIRKSIDSVQKCHNTVFEQIERQQRELESEPAWHASCFMSRTSKADKYNEAKVHKLIWQLNTVLEYERLTCEAVRKITKKFDKRAGSTLCKGILVRMWSQGFFLDSSEGGNGRAETIHRTLLEMLSSRQKKSDFFGMASWAFGSSKSLAGLDKKVEVISDCSPSGQQYAVYEPLANGNSGFCLLKPEPAELWTQITSATDCHPTLFPLGISDATT